MEAKCYIAIFVFAALSTVLGYMIFHRIAKVAKVAAPSNLAAAPAATGATAATPLLATI